MNHEPWSMTVVELLERLAEQGIELVWWDTAGALWSAPPPAGALPWVAALGPELAWAVEGARTGHRWGACSACGRCQLRKPTPKRSAGCQMTPRCQGEVGRWVELPEAARRWSLTRTKVRVESTS
jgi:hypothetical protein